MQMTERDDRELLKEYVRNGSEEAFSALVERYVNLVYSAALRYTGNPDDAQEITQAVFIILARKAAGLRSGTLLGGWLYQTARLTAANFIKGQIRREHREQEACMQSTLNEPGDSAWTEIAPLLDEAMGHLAEADRNAVVMRYFQNKSAGEVGTAMKTTEAAAHKRTARALEKLRKFFTKRGVVLSVAVIASAISANSVQAAPTALTAAIAAVSAGGVGSSITITTLVKGTMKTMTWLKMKYLAGAALVVLLAGGAATLTLSQTDGGGGVGSDQMSEQAIVEKSRNAYATLSSYSDEGVTVSSVGGKSVTPHTFKIKLAKPGFYRVEWDQKDLFFDNKGVAWNAGNGDFVIAAGAGSPEKHDTKQNALAAATGVSGGAAGAIPGTFFNMDWGNQFAGSAFIRKPDGRVAGVDCYVMTSVTAGRTRTLWIGKQDFLIRQVENDTSAAANQAMMKGVAKDHPEMAAVNLLAASGAIKSVQTHTNIIVDQGLKAADFAPPEALKK
jgi:RNA polymerase sigma factor (sigma-70 family)